MGSRGCRALVGGFLAVWALRGLGHGGRCTGDSGVEVASPHWRRSCRGSNRQAPISQSRCERAVPKRHCPPLWTGSASVGSAGLQI
jgi:hypothetical protein